MTSTKAPGRMGRKVVVTTVLALVFFGLGLALYLAMQTRNKPDLACNGHTMGPGDSCLVTEYVDGRAVGTHTETYEDRVKAARTAPVTTGRIVADVVAMTGAFALCEAVAIRLWRTSGGAATRGRR